MDGLFSSGSVMGSHGEGLRLQSLISCRRPPCAPSHGCHQACSPHRQAMVYPCGTSRSSPLFPPQPWARSSRGGPHSVLSSCAASSVWMPESLRTRRPASLHASPGTTKPAPAALSVRLCFPTSVWRLPYSLTCQTSCLPE